MATAKSPSGQELKDNSEVETYVTGGLITEETVFRQRGTDKHISRYSKYVSRDGDNEEKQGLLL